MDLNDLPKSWFDITLEQYRELKELEDAPDITGVELLFEQLAVLFDTDVEDPDLTNLDSDELFQLMRELKWLSQQPKAEAPEQWMGYWFRSFNQLTLGEFIDCEHFITEGWQNATRLCAIFMKQWRSDEWGTRIFEPYTYDIEERAKRFENLPIPYILGIIQEYENWKRDFMAKYDPLFEDNTTEPEAEKEELEGADRIEAMKIQKQEEAKKQWSWENTLWALTNGDISRFESVFNTSVILVFNVMSMRKVLDV